MSELVPGGNLPLPGGPLTLRVPGPFDVSALVTDGSGTVGGDADFVFYNQPAAPGVRLRGDTLTVDPGLLRAGATRVTLVVSAADPGTPLGTLPAPALQVSDGRGRTVARFAPPRPGGETVLLLAEVYRRGPDWKLRALGQGYADGLAGLARDFGVDVLDEPAPPHPSGPGPIPTRPPSGHGATPGRTPTDRAAAQGRTPNGGEAARGRTPNLGGAAAGRASTGHGPGPGRIPSSRAAAPGRTPVGGGAAAGSAGVRGGGGRVLASPDPDGFLPLVNSARAQVGSAPVVLDGRLVAAARAHAAEMAAAGRLGSEGRDGTSLHQRVGATGYTYVTVGEHLVSGPRTPAEFIDYCLRTERARRTLQDPAFTQAGLAYVTGPRGGDTYWTALWARPLTPDALARTCAEVVDLTNRERRAAGLPPLAVDPLLTAAAQAHSADMVARDFYAHTSPEGSQPWDRAAAAGSRRRTIGENIACGQRSPAEVVDGWMNSPGHRANILKPDFTHIGIGFVGGGRAGTYWTQLFGA
ncbi:CAP domain-containing protein [Streptomyces sp. NPDC026672]|uniref:CAP domain-containing protein n=1 Tax=unclassified Streptomyces TaxID=2593676 RepID=UPI0033C0AA6B